jgi:hypothetical protein
MVEQMAVEATKPVLAKDAGFGRDAEDGFAVWENRSGSSK